MTPHDRQLIIRALSAWVPPIADRPAVLDLLRRLEEGK